MSDSRNQVPSVVIDESTVRVFLRVFEAAQATQNFIGWSPW